MKNIIAALLALSLGAAGLPASAQSEQTSYPKAWMQISGAKSGINNFETVFVDNKDDWEKLWKRHSAMPGGKAKAIPNVNFKKERLVAVFLGERYTLGYRVCLTVFVFPDKPDQLYVIYKEIKPESGRMHAQVMVQPFVVRKVSKNIQFAYFEADRHYTYPEQAPKPGKTVESGEYRILPIGNVLERIEKVEGEIGRYRTLLEGRGL